MSPTGAATSGEQHRQWNGPIAGLGWSRVVLKEKHMYSMTIRLTTYIESGIKISCPPAPKPLPSGTYLDRLCCTCSKAILPFRDWYINNSCCLRIWGLHCSQQARTKSIWTWRGARDKQHKCSHPSIILHSGTVHLAGVALLCCT